MSKKYENTELNELMESLIKQIKKVLNKEDADTKKEKFYNITLDCERLDLHRTYISMYPLNNWHTIRYLKQEIKEFIKNEYDKEDYEGDYNMHIEFFNPVDAKLVNEDTALFIAFVDENTRMIKAFLKGDYIKVIATEEIL